MKGDQPLEIVWTFKDETITPETHQSMHVFKTNKNALLSIDSVSGFHSGEYTCIASNLAGTSTRSAVLVVNGILSKMHK